MTTDLKNVTSSTAEPMTNGFSLQINHALSLLTSKFGDEINSAFVTAPATQERAAETEAQKLDKIRVVEENKKAILIDMRILEASKMFGESGKDIVDKFVGFEQLGGSDYLDLSDDDDDDDDSDYNSSDDSDDDESDDDDIDEFDDEDDIEEDNATVAMSGMDESMRLAGMDESMRLAGTSQAKKGDSDDDDDDSDDDSDYSDSESDDSEFDYDSDESSIGSYGGLMADLEKTMGVDVPSALKVKGAMHGSTMSLCSLTD